MEPPTLPIVFGDLSHYSIRAPTLALDPEMERPADGSRCECTFRAGADILDGERAVTITWRDEPIALAVVARCERVAPGVFEYTLTWGGKEIAC